MHRIARCDENIDWLVVDDKQFLQYLVAHGLGDADALAVEVQLHEELSDNET